MSKPKYDLTPGCKTYTASLPEKIEYPHDFIRGYFDGDGHGGWYGPKRKPVIGFTSGSKALLRDVVDLIPFKMRGPYEGKGRSMSITTAGKDAFIRTRDWMYETESTLWMERKKIKLFLAK